MGEARDSEAEGTRAAWTDEALAKFEEQAHETIGKIAQGGDRRKAEQEALRRISKTKRELREDFQTTVLATQDEARQGTIQPLRIEEGVRVRLRDVREPARVRRKLGNDRLEVEAGFMKMQVSMDDVIEVLPEAPTQGGKLPKGVSYRPAPELAPVHQEINVIGQRAEEACDAVDGFLDRAVMATANRVRIVHGHGMGVPEESHPGAYSATIPTWRGFTRRRSRKAAAARLWWNCGNKEAIPPVLRLAQSMGPGVPQKLTFITAAAVALPLTVVLIAVDNLTVKLDIPGMGDRSDPGGVALRSLAVAPDPFSHCVYGSPAGGERTQAQAALRGG